MNGFDGFIYASLFIRVVTSVVAQVIRIIRSIRGPFYLFLPRGHSSHLFNSFNPWSFYPFLPRGLIFTMHTFSSKWGEVERFIFVYRLAEDGSLLKEGGVRLSVWALRACSYKTKAEA